MNGSTASPTYDGNDLASLSAKRISAIAIMAIIDVFVVAANIFVAIAISRAAKLRSSFSSLFVMNLCMLDLLAGGTIMPKSIAVYVANAWPWDHTTCIANGFLNTFLSFGTIFAICIITVEKFYCIKYPMHHAGNMTVYKTVVLIILTWALAVVFATLPIMGWNAYEFNKYSGCCWPGWRKNTQNQALMLFNLITIFLFPATLIAVVNIQLYRVARRAVVQIQPSNMLSLPERTEVKQEKLPDNKPVCRISAIKCDPKMSVAEKRATDATKPDHKISIIVQPLRRPSTGTHTVEVPQTLACHSLPVTSTGYASPLVNGEQVIEVASNVKAFKTLLASFSAFLLLWGPYFILQAFRVMDGTTEGHYIVEPVATWLSYFSYAVNPLVYGYFNAEIRMECFKIVRKLCCKKASEGSAVVRISQMNVSREDFFQFLERTC